MASAQNSRQAYLNLALATAAFTVAFVAWSIISPLSREIQAEFKLDNTAIALLIAVPTLLGVIMRVPVGILTDRFGGRKVFTALLLFTMLPVFFLGFANSYWTYILGAFFLGTAGASFAAGVPFVSRWFTPDRQGTARGIYGIGNIGTAAAVFATGPLVSRVRRTPGRVLVLLDPRGDHGARLLALRPRRARYGRAGAARR
jgi:nitrate/nitrite transporter NarK